MNNTRKYQKRLMWGGLLVLALLGTWSFANWTANLTFPGKADPAFYVEMAKNISEEGSFTIDYIWHYFNKPDRIEHYAFDYWLPGTSLIQAVFISITGKPLIGAALASFLLLIALSLIFVFAMRKFGYSRSLSVAAGLTLYCMLVPLFMNLLTTPFYLFFASTTLLMLGMYLHKESATFLYFCFLFAALAYWIRGDALLLFPFLIATVILLRGFTSARKELLFGFLIYVGALTPLILLNLSKGGFAFPPSNLSLYLSDYQDLYAFWPTDNLWTWLHENGLKNILRDRIDALLRNFANLFQHRPYIVIGLIPALWIIIHYINKRKMPGGLLNVGFLILAYSTLIYLFYGFLLPYYKNGVLISLSFASVGMLIIMTHAAHQWFGKHALAATFGFLALFGVGASMNERNELNETGTVLPEKYETLCSEIHHHFNEPVVMAQRTWDLSYECDLSLIKMPSDNLSAVAAAIEKYGVNALLIDEKWVGNSPALQRKASSDTFQIDGIEFERTWSNRDWKFHVYEIK